MAKWGSCDYRQLQELEKRLEQLAEVDADALCRQAAGEIARILMAKARKRTPVGVPPRFDKPDTVEVEGDKVWKQIHKKNGERVFQRRRKKYRLLTTKGVAQVNAWNKYWSGYQGGALHRGWCILPVEKVGNSYIVTVKNNEPYASYVEYGHRQEPGRYVPALGKSLKASWVKGAFMLTISEQEVRALAPGLLEKMVYEALREVFT